jgi:hypothetical protein
MNGSRESRRAPKERKPKDLQESRGQGPENPASGTQRENCGDPTQDSQACPTNEIPPAETALLERFLCAPTTWGGAGSANELKGVRAVDMLHALSGLPSERDELLLLSEPDQKELNAISEALLEFDAQPQTLSVDLRARLRGLVPRESTEELAGRVGGKASSRRRRRVTTRRMSRAGSARTKTGSGPVPGKSAAPGLAPSRRRRPGSTRRRSGAVPRVRQPRSVAPAWAMGVLAAAAGLLVALAIALQTPDVGAGRNEVAKVDLSPRRPLVSSVGKDRPRPSTQPSPLPEKDPGLGPESLPVPPPRARPDSSPLQPSTPGTTDPETPSVGSEPVGPAVKVGGTQRRPPSGKTGETGTPKVGPGPEASRSPAERRPESIVDDGGRLEVALHRVGGSVAVSSKGGSWRPLTRQANTLTLAPGDRLRSTRGGFVSVDDGSFEICMDASTEILVRGAAGGPVLGLERGRMHCEVRSLPSDRHFVVATRQGDYAVLGTMFAVEARADSSRVLVAEGTVKARNSGGEAKVGAGLSSTLASSVGEDGSRRLAAPDSPKRFKSRDLKWAARLRPARQFLYSVSFDDKKQGGFEGTLHRDGRGGLALGLTPLEGNKYWGKLARIREGRIAGFRPGPDVYVQFSVFVESPVAVMFGAYNSTQKKEFKQNFAHPGGYWRTFTVPLLELSTYFDPGKNPVRAGDLFVDFEVYAGEPGETAEILLDEVQIYRRVYR